ncbi:uncharacterized protein LOC133187756 [Saccostrea echinata]|uniref:uncharacterized protein LOC133187756 n=1 Tax=Saccostrea echinata TaxID=191078 RepID=UPI002A81BE47|nr:uncharacterized protein LOC133187756 [Saccostrea echinata]
MILENRDPRSIIGEQAGIRFNQIIAEPKVLKSHSLYWYSSTICYERWRLFVYQCLSCLTGPCIANSVASSIGGLMFTVIWIITPTNRLCKKCAGGCEDTLKPGIHGCCPFGKLFKKCKKVKNTVDGGSIDNLGILSI